LGSSARTDFSAFQDLPFEWVKTMKGLASPSDSTRTDAHDLSILLL
jgi:pyruvate/2-oxoacid:ferredoxin oxidoreductase alpha subunit